MNLSDRATRTRVNKALRERGVPAKVCSKCFAVRGHGAYDVVSAAPDGRHANCKQCRKLTNARTYRDNAEDIKARNAAWRANNYEQHRHAVKSWKEANPDKVREMKAGYRARHPESHQRRVVNWKRRNPDRCRAHSSAYRARKADAIVEPFTSRDLHHDWEDHDLYACFFCGGPAAPLHTEHFYPLKPADEDEPPGPHALFNLVPACETCNLSKSNKEPWAYLRQSLAEQGTDLDAALAGLEAIARRRRA